MSEKIKVLHIIKSLGRGGAEMLLPETLKLHDKKQFEFHYIYFLPWKNQMVEALETAGGKVTCFKATNNLFILLKWRDIIRYVKKNDIQLLHCHLPWAGFVGRLVHRSTKTKVLYTEHNKQERYHDITKWINKLTFSWQTKVIAVSKDVADSISKNIGNRGSLQIISNGVNTIFFKREKEWGDSLKKKLNIPQNAIVVGIVSVFRFQKRLLEWIDVFAKSSEQCPNLYGVIVGDGPLREEISNHISTRKMESKIRMPGLQTDVKPWYSLMDVFMMTSVFEGLPVALLEAMSMECAILTTNAGGIKEVVQNNVNGIIVSVDDWIDLSDHLTQIALDENRRKQLAILARQRVEQFFSMKQMVDNLETLYNQCHYNNILRTRND